MWRHKPLRLETGRRRGECDMKTHSIQFKFLITIISAMLAITLFIGGLSIYEVDHFVQQQAESFVKASCEKEATQVNDIFGDMEKSVHIMESYVLGLINNKDDISNEKKQDEIDQKDGEIFDLKSKLASISDDDEYQAMIERQGLLTKQSQIYFK